MPDRRPARVCGRANETIMANVVKKIEPPKSILQILQILKISQGVILLQMLNNKRYV